MTLMWRAFIALAAIVAPAFAQETGPSRIEDARAMIASFEVSDLFAPVDGDKVTVRHTASGLTCSFYGDETNARLVVFSGLARGEDVGCVNDRTDQARTLYATRYPDGVTAAQAMADAVASIRNRFADAQPTPARLHMRSDGLPEVADRHFLITLREEQWITSVFVAQHRGWTIKLRFTARAVDEDAVMAAQLEANAVFTLALLKLVEPAASVPAPH